VGSARGCHNINFVTPEHVVAQILEALPANWRHEKSPTPFAWLMRP
jgi:uncharacterized Fe-S radical SAM superfamily protein PflX